MNMFTLTFPILSIGDFHCPPMASVDMFISAFHEVNILNEFNACKFVMVHPKDLPNEHYQVHCSEIKKLNDLEISTGGKFRFLVGDMCSMESIGEIDNLVAIVHPSNHKFTEKGGFLNQKIHECVGRELKSLSTVLYPIKKKGVSYPIPLPEQNCFRQREGCRYIIQILTPNLNPALPDCEKSLEDAKLLLRQCYIEIFTSFLKIITCYLQNNTFATSSPPLDETPHSQDDIKKLTTNPIINESHVHNTTYINDIDNNAKKSPLIILNSPITIQTITPTDITSPNTSSISNTSNASQFPDYRSPTYSYTGTTAPLATAAPNKSHIPMTSSWRDSLYQYINRPSTSGSSSNKNNNMGQRSQVYYETDDIVVIYDAYPKSRIHLLLLPKHLVTPPIQSILDITTATNHTTLIATLYELGNQIRNSPAIRAAAQGWRVRMGFHAVPSLQPLHMHLISSDFHSDALKKKLHWNSFNTDFFIDSEKIMSVLTSTSAPPAGNSNSNWTKLSDVFSVDLLESQLEMPMTCRSCQTTFAKFSLLKRHISSCR